MLFDSIFSTVHPIIKCPDSFKDMENKIKEQSLKQESMEEGSGHIEKVINAIEGKDPEDVSNNDKSKLR